MPHLGLESAIPLCLYLCTLTVVLLSIFWRPIAGLYFLVPLIPLQTIRYRLNDLPLGASFVYIILAAVAIGLIIHREDGEQGTPWTLLLAVYGCFTFISLCLGSLYLSFPMPWELADRRFPDWADYMTMPLLLVLVAAAVRNLNQVKILVVLIGISALLVDKSFWNAVSGHDFSTFSDDLRDGGTLGYAGSNGLATLQAQLCTLFVALAVTAGRRSWKLVCFGAAFCSALCLVYSLSRGGYLACIAGLLFVAVVRARVLLVPAAVFALTWATVVPPAVVSRVQMTYDQNGELDHSSETRVTLWEDALELVESNPLLGTGLDTYRYMKRVGEYEDTHNIYMKILVETGAVGLLFFLWILGKAVFHGLRLAHSGVDPLLQGLGLGLAGWAICAAVACTFGDRWTYFQVQGWFWVIAGLVARGATFNSALETSAEEPSETAAELGQEVTA